MKTKLKIFEIFLIFIAVLLLIGAVSASNENISDDTIKMSELETTEPLTADDSDSSLQSVDNEVISQDESSQEPVLTKSNDNTKLSSGNLSSNETTKVQATITAPTTVFKTEYHSGQSFKATIKDATTGKGIKTVLKVQYTKQGKSTYEYYYTNANGIAYITPHIPVGTYSVKITVDDSNITTKTFSKKVTITKTTVKVTAKKVSAYKGKYITLKAVLSKTKIGEKINQGKVKFTINGKSYTVKVKKGVATKKLKLKKIKTYKYTAQFIANNNIKKSKVATGKATIKQTYSTRISAQNVYGFLGEKKKYQIYVTTTSGKKVSGGQIKLTWNGKKAYCNVKNGVAKLVGTLGGNYQGERNGNQYYGKIYITKVKVTYIPASGKYKTSTGKFTMTSTYKCSTCGRTTTHAHTVNGVTTWIYVN